MSIMIYYFISHQAYKGTSKQLVAKKKIDRQIKFMKYSGIEGECPALALGLCHTSPHPQFSLSYCGHISKKTHQPQDIRLKMKVGNGSAMVDQCNVWLQNLVMWFCIGGKLLHTSYNSFNKRTKVSSLEITIFDLKMMVNSGLEFFILKFTEVRAPSEVAAQLPGQFSLSG